MFFSLSLLLLTLSSLVLAAPLDFTSALVSETSRGRPGFGGLPVPLCPISKSKGTDLLTGLAVNAGEVPNYVFIGRGTQNYTCGSAGVYVSVGAVADFYDASCLISLPRLDHPRLRRSQGHPFPFQRSLQSCCKALLPSQRRRFHQPRLQALFERERVRRKEDRCCCCSQGPLGLVSGTLGKTFYRVDTAGGQPPATCSNFTDTGVKTVPYAAIYWSYK